MMIGNQGGHLRKPVHPSRTGLSIQELKAMTALRMSQGPDVLINSFAGGSESSLNKPSQQTPAPYVPVANNNSRSRRQASRAAATMYADQMEFGQVSAQLQPPSMTRVSPSPPPAPIQSTRVEKQPAHSLTVQELKELTRMRLARVGGVNPGQGPGSNNTSISTDGDLDLELHHHHTAGVHRKNSGNSLLTTTTLESRESDSRPQSRSGTISPVSDSFVDDNEVSFNYNGGALPPSLVMPSNSAINSRRQGNIVVPGYLPVHMGAPAIRTVNFHPNQNPTRGSGSGTGLTSGNHSSSQIIHAQATAQMAHLMDQHRRENGRSDVIRIDDNISTFESLTGSVQSVGAVGVVGGLSGGNIDPMAPTDFPWLQQRFEENRLLDVQRRQQQQQQQQLNVQSQPVLATRQQQAVVRRKPSPFSFQDNNDLNQDQIIDINNINQNFDVNDNSSNHNNINNMFVPNQYERRENINCNIINNEICTSENINSNSPLQANIPPSVEHREVFNGQYDHQRYRQQPQQLVAANKNNVENNDFRFSNDLSYPPPPVVLGMLKKQQAMAMNGLYMRENVTPNNVNGNIVYNTEALPPPIMTQLMTRGVLNQDSMGCSSPGSMRHKSALTIACPGAVRERTLSDVNSLAFQMAEACLDSSSTPSTPKFSHRSFPANANGGVGAMSVGGVPDYLAQALRRMNSTDSVSSVGSNTVSVTNSLSPMNLTGSSLSAPRGFGIGSSFLQSQLETVFLNSNINNNDNNI